MNNGIREADVVTDNNGVITSVRLVFGPHYFVELRSGDGQTVEFCLGATHHGFRADASEIAGELERIINEVRDSHPSAITD